MHLLINFFQKWRATLKKEIWTYLGVKRENVVVHVPETVIERVLRAKNASGIAHVNGNDHEADLNLQRGIQSNDIAKKISPIYYLVVCSVTMILGSGVQFGFKK